jgi:hypothetical protein
MGMQLPRNGPAVSFFNVVQAHDALPTQARSCRMLDAEMISSNPDRKISAGLAAEGTYVGSGIVFFQTVGADASQLPLETTLGPSGHVHR